MQTVVNRAAEIVLHSRKAYANPFLDVQIDAVFTHEDGAVLTLPGFWNGENEWKVRFSPDRAGNWDYRVPCTDPENGDRGARRRFTAVRAENETELERRGFVTLRPGDRYFTYADGTPFLWIGDTHWQMPDYERMNECNVPGCTCGNQFRHLADDRAAKGFTVYQTYFESSNTTKNPKCRHPWWREPYSLIEPRSFNETMDVMIDYLAQKGFVIALGLGCSFATVAAMGEDPAPLRAFARYCVARYACYPVVWITAQEITAERNNTTPVWREVAALVGELDGYHRPNSAHMHPMPADDPRAVLLDRDPWHQYWTLQGGHGGVRRLKKRSFYESYYRLASGKPFIESESQYEDIYCEGFCGCDAPRMAAWQAMLSGAAGVGYGVTGVWALGWNQRDDAGWPTFSPEPWYVGMEKPGSLEMGYLRYFMEYVGFPALEPSFDATFGELEARGTTAIAHRGQDVIVWYFFGSDQETGRLRGLAPGARYQARWFDPIGGGFLDLPDVITEDGYAPVPEKPTERDWVLLLNRVDLGPGRTEHRPTSALPLGYYDAPPALGARVPFVSFTSSSEEDGHPAACLTDGREDTVWRPFARATSVTFTADLGSVRHADYLRVCSRAQAEFLTDYRVEVSDDGKNWSILLERVNGYTWFGGDWQDHYDEINADFRYLRLFLLSRESPVKRELTHVALYLKP